MHDPTRGLIDPDYHAAPIPVRRSLQVASVKQLQEYSLEAGIALDDHLATCSLCFHLPASKLVPGARGLIFAFCEDGLYLNRARERARGVADTMARALDFARRAQGSTG